MAQDQRLPMYLVLEEFNSKHFYQIDRGVAFEECNLEEEAAGIRLKTAADAEKIAAFCQSVYTRHGSIFRLFETVSLALGTGFDLACGPSLTIRTQYTDGTQLMPLLQAERSGLASTQTLFAGSPFALPEETGPTKYVSRSLRNCK